jgi:hypothetical protein
MQNPANAATQNDRPVAGEARVRKQGTHIPTPGLST